MDGCSRVNLERLEGVALAPVEDGDILTEGPLKAEVLIERAVNDGREMDFFKSWRALIVRDLVSLLATRGVDGY